MPRSIPPLATSSKLQVMQEDIHHIVVSYDNVMVILWRGVTEPATCRRLYALAAQISKAHGGAKVSAVSVVERGAAMPSSEAREALSLLHEDPLGIAHRSASVFPESGFLAASIRSIVLGVMQRAGRRGGHNLFQRLDKALLWVTEGLSTAQWGTVSVPKLIQELENLRGKTASRVA